MIVWTLEWLRLVESVLGIVTLTYWRPNWSVGIFTYLLDKGWL